MRPPPPSRETFATAIALEAAGGTVDLRLRSSDEGRQAVDAAGIGDHRLRLRLILRLRTMFTLIDAALYKNPCPLTRAD